MEQETAQKPSTPNQTQTQTPEQTTGTPNTTDANGVQAPVNPNTGEVMKPGDSYINQTGAKVTYLEHL